MDYTLIAISVIGLIGSVYTGWSQFVRGARNQDKAQENAEQTVIYGGYGTLLKAVQDDNKDLRTLLDETEKRWEERLKRSDERGEANLQKCKEDMQKALAELEERLRKG